MSPAPRSASSSSSRETAKSARSSTTGSTRRRSARTPSRRAGHLFDPPEVGRRVVPAVRAVDVDQLARRQVRDEPALGLVLDLGPGRLGDRGQVAVEVVHHSVPFRLPMPSEPGDARGGIAARLRLGLHFGHRFGCEQIGPQVAVEDRVAPAQPLEGHGRVFLLLVAVVREDVGQARVVRRLDALVVPVDRLELLDQRREGTVAVDRRLVEQLGRLVQSLASHGAPT